MDRLEELIVEEFTSFVGDELSNHVIPEAIIDAYPELFDFYALSHHLNNYDAVFTAIEDRRKGSEKKPQEIETLITQIKIYEYEFKDNAAKLGSSSIQKQDADKLRKRQKEIEQGLPCARKALKNAKSYGARSKELHDASLPKMQEAAYYGKNCILAATYIMNRSLELVIEERLSPWNIHSISSPDNLDSEEVVFNPDAHQNSYVNLIRPHLPQKQPETKVKTKPIHRVDPITTHHTRQANPRFWYILGGARLAAIGLLVCATFISLHNYKAGKEYEKQYNSRATMNTDSTGSSSGNSGSGGSTLEITIANPIIQKSSSFLTSRRTHSLKLSDVYEFGEITREEVNQRTDSFFKMLQNLPSVEVVGGINSDKFNSEMEKTKQLYAGRFDFVEKSLKENGEPVRFYALKSKFDSQFITLPHGSEYPDGPLANFLMTTPIMKYPVRLYFENGEARIKEFESIPTGKLLYHIDIEAVNENLIFELQFSKLGRQELSGYDELMISMCRDGGEIPFRVDSIISRNRMEEPSRFLLGPDWKPYFDQNKVSIEIEGYTKAYNERSGKYDGEQFAVPIFKQNLNPTMQHLFRQE